MKASILPARPGTVSDADKEALREAGIIVVEHKNPKELRLLVVDIPLASDDMLYAAISAIHKADNYTANRAFVVNMQALAQEAFDKKRAPSTPKSNKEE